MSQEKLGDALGLTFQQVQKYEKGTNRIGASRLQQIGQILGVPPSFFFENMPEAQPPGSVPDGSLAEDTSSTLLLFLSSTEGLVLTRAFVRIRSPKLRRKLIDLVVQMADGQDDDAQEAAPPETAVERSS